MGEVAAKFHCKPRWRIGPVQKAGMGVKDIADVSPWTERVFVNADESLTFCEGCQAVSLYTA